VKYRGESNSVKAENESAIVAKIAGMAKNINEESAA